MSSLPSSRSSRRPTSRLSPMMVLQSQPCGSDRRICRRRCSWHRTRSCRVRTPVQCQATHYYWYYRDFWRLQRWPLIKIENIEALGCIMEVDLSVYDSDGQEGINIPNSMESDALHEIGANMGSTMVFAPSAIPATRFSLPRSQYTISAGKMMWVVLL